MSAACPWSRSSSTRRSGPPRASDELIAPEPVCILTLANALNVSRGASLQPFGPALNLDEQAAEKSSRHVPVKALA